MLRTLATVATLIALSGCARAMADIGFERFDENDDQRLTPAEYREFLDDTDLYENYDDNDDGKLSQTEYAEAVDNRLGGADFFAGFDRDRDGGLDLTEFANGLFGAFDANRDGLLNEDEFEDAADGLELEF